MKLSRVSSVKQEVRCLKNVPRYTSSSFAVAFELFLTHTFSSIHGLNIIYYRQVSRSLYLINATHCFLLDSFQPSFAVKADVAALITCGW